MSRTNEQYDEVIEGCKSIFLRKQGLWYCLAGDAHYFGGRSDLY